jgi:hypothetical protein
VPNSLPPADFWHHHGKLANIHHRLVEPKTKPQAEAQGFAESRARKQRLQKYTFWRRIQGQLQMPLWKTCQ